MPLNKIVALQPNNILHGVALHKLRGCSSILEFSSNVLIVFLETTQNNIKRKKIWNSDTGFWFLLWI